MPGLKSRIVCTKQWRQSPGAGANLEETSIPPLNAVLQVMSVFMPTENETGVGAPGPGELPFRSPLFGLLQESLAGGHKDREFLYFEGKSYSFAQVHELALRLASLLAREGVARGERVAVYLYNSPEFVVSLLALNYLGAVVVPVNPLLKKDEISHIVHDASAFALLTESHLLAHVAPETIDSLHFHLVFNRDTSVETAVENAFNSPAGSIRINVAALEELDGALPRPSLALSQADDAALIVYTSGTTGKPKGAVLSFGNVAYTVSTYPTRFHLLETDRLLGILPLCHLYGLLVVLAGALRAGASITLMRQFDADKAALLLKERRITVLSAVPTMHQFILLSLDKLGISLPDLRLITTGGAAISLELLKQVEETFSVPVLEGYALTETSVIATLNPVDNRKAGSVGPGFDLLTIMIQDENGAPLSPGKTNVGEVCIAGPCVMSGYWQNPEATAAAIVNGFLRTGDLGYLDEDGYLYIVGRSKELIVRGGMNIYPREVENVISQLPQVAEVAVFGIPDRFMGERVKACIVLKPNLSLTAEQVQSYCGEHLADYKMPRTIDFVASLPRNSTGKVLKRLLS